MISGSLAVDNREASNLLPTYKLHSLVNDATLIF